MPCCPVGPVGPVIPVGPVNPWFGFPAPKYSSKMIQFAVISGLFPIIPNVINGAPVGFSNWKNNVYFIVWVVCGQCIKLKLYVSISGAEALFVPQSVSWPNNV